MKALYAWVLAIAASLCVNVSYAQLTIKGTVLDSKSGNPISEATVRIPQTNIGVATNSRGEFILKNIPEGKHQLRASAMGYSISNINVDKSSSNLTIKLNEAPVNLNQVVVTGTGTHRRLKDTPVPVEVISSNDLKNAGVTTLQNAVTMLAPSFSFETTPMANYTTMNGMSNEHLLVLVDGQKLAGNISGATDISRINMNNVKRIEILKGAASSLYGSDAIGGVINIITETPKNSINASSYTKYEKYNQLEQNVTADFTTKKFGSYSSYTYRQSDGWQLCDSAVTIKNGIAGKPFKTVRNASDKFSSNIFNQKFIFNPTKSLSLYVNGSFYNNSIDRPSTTVDKSGYEYNLYSQTYNFGIGGKYLLGGSDYISLDLYNDNYKNQNEYIVDTKTYKKGDKALNQKQHYWSSNLKGVFKLGSYNKLVAGTENIKENLENPDALAEKKSVYTLSLYAQDEFKIKNFQAVAGGRYTYHQKFGSRFTPKISLMYTMGPVNTRISYASGFRAPSLKELYYIKEKGSSISLGNPNLNPEKSNYYSINFEYIHNLFSASVTGYINEVKDLINLVTLKNPQSEIPNYDPKYTYKRYENVSKAKIKGLDFNIKGYVGAGLTIGGGYSYTYARDNETHTNLLRSIRHSGNVNMNWEHNWGLYNLNLNLAGHLQSKRFEDAQEDAPGFSTWNFAVRNTLHIKNFTIEPSVGINNLFNYKDNRYYGFYYSTLSPGRTIFVSLLIKFSK